MEEKYVKNDGCVNFYHVLRDQVGVGIFIFQNILKDLEKRKADLNAITESGAALRNLVEGGEAVLEEKLCVLSAGWSRVRTWAEDWCSTLMVSFSKSLMARSRFLPIRENEDSLD